MSNNLNNTPPIEKICTDCGKIFYQKRESFRHRCTNCQAKFNHRNRKKEKICKYCGVNFISSGNQVNCENCRKRRVVNHNNGVEQKILCSKPNCNNIVSIKQTKIQVKTERKGEYVCESCKVHSLKEYSDYMKTDNNPSIKKYGRKRKIVRMTKEEFSHFQSRRMMGDNNPMKNPETKEKSLNSEGRQKNNQRLREKIGIKHHLWKGNTRRNITLRSRINNPWRKPIIENANFMCEICKNKDVILEVHHSSETFKEIILKFVSDKELRELSNDEFEILSKKIVDYHINNVVGLCVCVNCHKEIDEQRR